MSRATNCSTDPKLREYRFSQQQDEKSRNLWPSLVLNLIFQIECRMSELSEIIATKDAAIEELKSRLAKGAAGGINRRTSGGGGPSAGGGGGIPETEENVALLTEALKEREDKIEHLQRQLAEAAR